MDGFRFPYQEALARSEQEGIDPEKFVAFANCRSAYGLNRNLLFYGAFYATRPTLAPATGGALLRGSRALPGAQSADRAAQEFRRRFRKEREGQARR